MSVSLTHRVTRFRRACLAAIVCAAAIGIAPAIEIDFVSPTDPKILEPPVTRDISPRPIPLWIAALSSREVDLQRESARSIALAHGLGMPKLKSTAPALIAALSAPNCHPTVAVSAAQALIALDAREAAPQLLARLAAGPLDYARIVEPALAKWDYAPARKTWLARLDDPGVAVALRALAAESLGIVGEKAATAPLCAIAADRLQAPSLRVAAARGLSLLKPQGFEQRCDKLAGNLPDVPVVDRLVAAVSVSRLDTPAARQLLVRLAMDAEPAVAGAALGGLYGIDFRLILPLADRLAGNDDANVRLWVAKAWVAERTAAAIARLRPLLDDPHPGVRAYVRESYVSLAAAADLRTAVIEQATLMLATERWRGLEQATMVLVALDQKQVVDRLVTLLDHARPEAFVAAAWGLRRLAVRSTLPAMLRRAQRVYDAQKQSPNVAGLDHQLAHLAEAFGSMRYMESAGLLINYIPKESAPYEVSRVTAIWALGHLYAGKPRPDVVEALRARLRELRMPRPVPLESLWVIEMSALSLGRMRARDAEPELREFGGTSATIGFATQYTCRWALHEIFGEPIPPYQEFRQDRLDWFLEPVEK